MNKPFLVCLIILSAQLLSLSDCGTVVKVSKRMISGQISDKLLPYQVLIYTSMDRNSVKTRKCAGSLITVNYVLTSADCIADGFLVQLIFGAHFSDRSESTQVVMSSFQFLKHSKWVYNKKPDNIGLVKLPETIKLVDGVINVVKLPPKTTKSPNYDWRFAIVAGWGASNDSPFSINTVLRQVQIQIVPQSKCRVWYKPLDSSTICGVGEPSGNPCIGDEGAPLVDMKNNIQVGIVSFGPKKCDSEQPYVYTKVAEYLDWIEQHSDFRVNN